MLFDIQRNLRSAVEPCTPDLFWSLVRSPQVTQTIIDIQQLMDAGKTEEAKALKKGLPAVCWQAHYTDGKRHNASAVPSGLYILDIDHISSALGLNAAGISEWLDDKGTAEWVRLGILIVHLTPSGDGLRFVAKMLQENANLLTIEDHQRWLCAQLFGNDELYDHNTKDWSRLSFLVPFSYFKYTNGSIFSADPELTLDTATSSSAPSPLIPHPSPLTAPADAHTDDNELRYAGFPVMEIARYIIEKEGVPQEGERNTRLYGAMRIIRYICDFNPSALANNCPNYGLSAQEMFTIARSACDSTRASKMPEAISDAITELGLQHSELSDEFRLRELEELEASLPPLPPGIAELVRNEPSDYQVPAIFACLPPMGALATNARFNYWGEEHPLAFFTMIVGPQASGKSFTRNLQKRIMKRIDEADAIERAKEQRYIDERRAAKNRKQQPEDPHAQIRRVPSNISIAKLLQRLDYANGKILFTFDEEMDSVAKSNKSGAWSQKSDIYRKAFDHSEYGQDYMSDNSYSATLKVAYNMLVCGTPAAHKRFFSDAENGLVSRMCFTRIPPQFGASMPKRKEFPERAAAIVDSVCNYLYEIGYNPENPLVGEIQSYKFRTLMEHMESWLEQKKRVSLRTLSNPLDILKRRSAVIGFRAGCLAYLCYASQAKVRAQHWHRIKTFATWIADYVLMMQMTMFADQIEAQDQESITNKKLNFPDIFASLPDTFTREELENQIATFKKRTRPKEIIRLWKANKFIEKNSDKTFTKIAQDAK